MTLDQQIAREGALAVCKTALTQAADAVRMAERAETPTCASEWLADAQKHTERALRCLALLQPEEVEE